MDAQNRTINTMELGYFNHIHILNTLPKPSGKSPE